MVVSGILNVSHVSNTGVAFGFLQGNNILLGIISLAVAALIVYYRKKVSDGIESAALALILGGTLSNLVDRMFRGEVVDYITLKWIPTFNIADAALTAGAVLIITSYIVEKFRRLN